ncbi:hypothetical protein Avbf_18461 [Armadillidium vulgare]|nr:hypothetical protein Avbf_18461 [Armadillidium vulgare]
MVKNWVDIGENWEKLVKLGKNEKMRFLEPVIRRMEDFASCNICVQVFDSLHFIPKILKCGHTFCSPCLIKLLQENPFCPNCSIQLKEIESSLPMKLNVKILDKCLAKLEELTVSQVERIGTVNTRKILDEIDEDLKKTDDVVLSYDIKRSISILLSSFKGFRTILIRDLQKNQ